MTETLRPDLAPAYLATWNATDATARRALLDRDWAADVTYTDHLADVTGREELDATIAAAKDQFPGFVFAALGDPDTHHDQTRFRWGLGTADGEQLVEDHDVVLADADGRIVCVSGFLNRVPTA